jgi:7-cyano-7-deazaguanine synthase
VSSTTSSRSDRALVLFSGGQDSTTCLAWALERFEHVETVGFDYRQRHAIELSVRAPIIARMRREFPQWTARLGEDHLVDAGVIATLSASALTTEREIEIEANGLPNTFVPARNLLFLTLAAALAYRRSIGVLVGGMCETDFSGYPDCRNETIIAMQRALTLGMAEDIAIETPLMWIDKAATWALADELGGAPLIALIEEETHTCYLGSRGVRNPWGYGCGACPACVLRKAGHARWISTRG